MKKWQEWTIAILLAFVVAGVIGAGFWYLTEDKGGEATVIVVNKTEEQKDLEAVDADLESIDDLDLAALEAVDKDLQAIDLESL